MAWILAKEENIVPIVGTKRLKYLEENSLSLSIDLNPNDLRHLDEIAPQEAAFGARYPEEAMKTVLK